MSKDEKRPAPELLEDGSILVPLKDDGQASYRMVKLAPGEAEHAEWLALIQRERGRPATTSSRTTTGGGFAFWDGQTFVGLGTVGLVVAAILFFTESGPFEEAASEPCIVTATAGKLCGDDARKWCDVSDPLRSLDPAASTKSQGVCDDIR
jgi:hypothetical protein